MAGRLDVVSAIALSPFASAADGAVESRYRDVHMPVLSLTGNVIGLVTGPAQRTLPFEQMPGPDGYLVLLPA